MRYGNLGRRKTPVDFGEGCPEPQVSRVGPVDSLRTRRSSQQRMQSSNLSRRPVPEDYGAEPPIGVVTVRKFHGTTGEELWHNARGDFQGIVTTDGQPIGFNFPVTSRYCAAIHEVQLTAGGYRYATSGHAAVNRNEGCLYRWRSAGSADKTSASAATGDFDAGVWGQVGVPANGGQHSTYSSGKLWLAGVANDSGTATRVIQAYDKDTLISSFASELTNSSETALRIARMGPSATGALVAASYASTVGATTTTTGSVDHFDTSGNLTASIGWTTAQSGVSAGAATLTGVSNVEWVWTQRFGTVSDRTYFPILQSSGGTPRVKLVVANPTSILAVTDSSQGGNWTNVSGWKRGGNASDSVLVIRPAVTAGGIVLIDNPYSNGGGWSIASSGLSGLSGFISQSGHSAVDTFSTDGSAIDSYRVPAVLGVDAAGSVFISGTVSGVGTCVARIDGTTATWCNTTYPLQTLPYKIVTANGVHYLIGSTYNGQGTNSEVSALDAATGDLLWTARHSDTSEDLMDGVVGNDGHLYVCGEASSYVPS